MAENNLWKEENSLAEKNDHRKRKILRKKINYGTWKKF
jgi:hypothetical protein